MFKACKYFIPVCYLLLLICYGCNNSRSRFHQNNHTEAKSRGEKSYRIKLNLAMGDRFYFTIVNESKTTLEINEQKKNISNKYEIGLSYQVSKDSFGNLGLKIKYDKIHLVLSDKNNNEQVIDADNSDDSFDSVQKILSIIKGSELTVNIDTAGNIIAAHGNKELMDKIISGMDAKDESTKQKVNQLVSQLLGDEFIKTNIGQGFKIFPDTAVYVGDSWERKNIESSGIDFTSNTIYTFESLDDNLAGINIEGTLINEKNTASNIMGKKVTANLKGSQQGTITADIQTGLIKKEKITTHIEGNIEVTGKEVPITIDLKKEISVKKSN